MNIIFHAYRSPTDNILILGFREKLNLSEKLTQQSCIILRYRRAPTFVFERLRVQNWALNPSTLGLFVIFLSHFFQFIIRRHSYPNIRRYIVWTPAASYLPKITRSFLSQRHLHIIKKLPLNYSSLDIYDKNNCYVNPNSFEVIRNLSRLVSLKFVGYSTS